MITCSIAGDSGGYLETWYLVNTKDAFDKYFEESVIKAMKLTRYYNEPNWEILKSGCFVCVLL